MNYYIDIIDTTDDTHTTVLENARANSLLLSWQGKDGIDQLDVVGSSLSFTLEATHDANEDGAFIHLFTGNEVKYRVELRREDDDSLLWQGFLLPDSYSEPYKTGNYFVELEANDGLGRLKGKYLADEYYTSEKSVVDIISSCLALTGLQFEIVFAPGIDNKIEKDWNNIYINGKNYVTSSRNWTAYKILQTFLQDTLSCCYQHKGVWYVEGLNKRNLQTYSAKKYEYDGALISDFTVEKTIKNIDGKILGEAEVTMVPPLNNITVTHTATSLQLPATIATEENDGWVTEAAGVVGTIYSTDWYPSSSGFWAVAKAPDYKLWLENAGNATFQSIYSVELRKKIYVKQDTKLKFNLKLSIDFYGNEGTNTISNLISDGDWTNPIYYKILVGNEILFTNIGDNVTTAETIQFNEDKEAEITFEFIIPESGLFDIVLYQPFGTLNSTRIAGIFIDDISLEEIGFDEDIIYTDTINENYTVDKEHELTFADDATGLSKCFLLGKLDDINYGYVVSNVIPITGYFTQNGNNYSVVSLAGANLIADNLTSLFYGGELIDEDLEVIYNYGGGEQMVVKTENAYTTGNFTIAVYRYLKYTDNRDAWEEWTDSIYEIERKRFPEAVMGVFSRLFENPIPKVDAAVQEVVYFGDLVSWIYMDESNTYVPTNCSFDLDDGNTKIIASKASYLQDNALVPPYVDAGPDIYLYDDESTASFDATAYDPDGTIVSYLWEHVSGTPAGTIASAATEDTAVTGLTGNNYTYQITVTDNDGLTASDTVNVIRVSDYTVSLVETYNYNDIDVNIGPYKERRRRYRVTVTPELPDNLIINLSSVLELETVINDLENVDDYTAEATITITKNGNLLQEWFQEGNEGTTDYTTLFSYINGDEIDIYLETYNEDVLVPAPPNPPNPNYESYARALYRLDFGTITGYPGVILGLPDENEIISTYL